MKTPCAVTADEQAEREDRAAREASARINRANSFATFLRELAVQMARELAESVS